MSYVIITVLKNEKAMMPLLINSVVKQTSLPLIWLIVDNYSDDGSWKLIKKLSQRFLWVKVVRYRNSNDVYGLENYQNLINFGMCYINKNLNLEPEFYSIVDADVYLPPNYFEGILNCFFKQKQIGILSGYVFERGMSLREYLTKNEQPTGCALVFRSECLFDLQNYHNHTVSLVLARKFGWQIGSVSKFVILHRRPSGKRKDMYRVGELHHYYGYHILYIIIKFIDYLNNETLNGAITYLSGYLSAFLLRKQKHEDIYVKEYFGKKFSRFFRTHETR